MKNSILESHFLEQDWIKAQPESFKTQLLENYHEELNGAIRYIDYFWSPMVYSLKDGWYYRIENGGIFHAGHFKSENDLTRLDKVEFHEKFPDIGNIEDTFLDKASIENELMLVLSPEDTEKWFLSLIEKYNNEEQKYILQALKLCKQKHHGQYRDEWTPYYTHPIFVAIKWMEFWLESKDIITLLLHDTIEDTDLSHDDIKNQFWEYVADKVRWLSKKEGWIKKISKEEYYQNILWNEKLALLKWLDRLANLFSLNFAEPEKKSRYLEETKDIIVPIVNTYHPTLTKELRRIIAYIENTEFQFPPELAIKANNLKEAHHVRKKLHETT